jgi:hypothetical protein
MEKQHFDLFEYYLVNQAKMFLEKYHEFFPFAAAIGLDGKLVPIGAYLDTEEPASQEVIEFLEKRLERL